MCEHGGRAVIYRSLTEKGSALTSPLKLWPFHELAVVSYSFLPRELLAARALRKENYLGKETCRALIDSAEAQVGLLPSADIKTFYMKNNGPPLLGVINCYEASSYFSFNNLLYRH